MSESVEEQLSMLLRLVVEELDIPHELHEQAVNEYKAVGRFLAQTYDGGEAPDSEVYPQGSFRLGTVVRPIYREDEYDIDLVCRLDLTKESTNQKDLKNKIGRSLKDYVAGFDQDRITPVLEEKRRCWTLSYRDRKFHLDALPSIPDPERVRTGILLPDRELRFWQPSNPIGYADWFRHQMEEELLAQKEARAKTLRASVEEVPDSAVKTALQRAVQVLKRHRDIHFRDEAEGRPISIIITTLAAKSYTWRENLVQTLVSIIEEMPRHIENREGVYWVPNPVQTEENFADKWKENPKLQSHFLNWLEKVRLDLIRAAGLGDLPGVIGKLGDTFGTSVASKAARRYADGIREKRESGNLTIGPTGILGASAGTKIRDHTFAGDQQPAAGA